MDHLTEAHSNPVGSYLETHVRSVWYGLKLQHREMPAKRCESVDQGDDFTSVKIKWCGNCTPQVVSSHREPRSIRFIYVGPRESK